jgi:hypothetical protein
VVEPEARKFNSDASPAIPSFVAEVAVAMPEASTVFPSFVAEVAVPETSEVGFRILQVIIVSHPIDLTKTSSIATVELALNYPQSTAEH